MLVYISITADVLLRTQLWEVEPSPVNRVVILDSVSDKLNNFEKVIFVDPKVKGLD